MKRDTSHGHEPRPVSGEALKNQRMAQEQAKKDSGIWGDLSVGIVEKNDADANRVYEKILTVDLAIVQ